MLADFQICISVPLTWMKNFLHFVLFRKMEWTDQHDVLFCREVIGFDLFTHKPGSKECG